MNNESSATPIQSGPSTEWFTQDRFGMFIHWGLYSNPAGVWNSKKIKHHCSEWLQASERIPRSEYQELAASFNPEKFNAEEWILEAKNAGMKYFLITSKHHDGFALWPTKASKYNIADATPFKRDILGELTQACRKHDMKIGFYYSHWQDWEGTGGDISTDHLEGEEYVHPTDSEFENYWQNKCLVQVRELIENYDPWFLWFDTWSLESFELITPQRQDELIALIRSLSKKCLVNSRIQFRAPSDQVDFMSTMDNSFPTKGFRKPWETSGTFNDSWGCHAMDYRWRPTKELIENLVKNASLGGNYQLNVGPMGNGCFQEAAIKHLREVGAWLRANGEAIYGTLGSTFDKMPWGHITRRPLDAKRTRLYLHLWKFTPGTAILLPGVSLHVIKAESIATGQPIEAELGEKGIWIRLPQELDPDDLPVIKLDVFEDSAGIPESRADHERELGQ